MQKFTSRSIQKLIPALEECRFSNGEMVFREGETEDLSLYYLVQGTVQVIY
jgi:CRP-like cAMP-binding protein